MLPESAPTSFHGFRFDNVPIIANDLHPPPSHRQHLSRAARPGAKGTILTVPKSTTCSDSVAAPTCTPSSPAARPPLHVRYVAPSPPPLSLLVSPVSPSLSTFCAVRRCWVVLHGMLELKLAARGEGSGKMYEVSGGLAERNTQKPGSPRKLVSRGPVLLSLCVRSTRAGAVWS